MEGLSVIPVSPSGAGHRGGSRGCLIEVDRGGGGGNTLIQVLQPLRDPYPSRGVLAPSSDLAFFFSFSLLSNPCGEEDVS